MRLCIATIVCCLAAACTSPPHRDANRGEQAVPASIAWADALAALRAGRIKEVIETDTDVVWFVSADGTPAWATRPAGHAWEPALRSMAKFDKITVD